MRNLATTAQVPTDEKTEARAGQGGREREVFELYDRYGKPLEGEHWGEYLAVSPGGEMLLGTDLLDLLQQAQTAFGPGNTLFKIGEVAVGKAP